MTKTWENLRPASFRGVAFEVESHSESGGRRVELHEYPLRDTPYAEDLGKKAGKWQIEAFLVNGKSGYAERRDKLREALNASGPGTLIHPYLGELSVSVDGYSLKETTREGGYCTFSISFVEAGQPVEPDVEKDTAANVLDKAEAAKEAATAGFLDEYMPLLEDLEGLAGKVPALLSEATAFLGTPLSILSRAQSAASSVLALPDRLASRILGYLGTIRQLGGIATSGLKMNALTALLGKKSAGTASSWLVTSNGVIAGIVGETSWPQAGGGSIGGGTSSGGASGGPVAVRPLRRRRASSCRPWRTGPRRRLSTLSPPGPSSKRPLKAPMPTTAQRTTRWRLGTPLSTPLMKSSARTVPTPCLQRFPSSLSPSTRI